MERVNCVLVLDVCARTRIVRLIGIGPSVAFNFILLYLINSYPLIRSPSSLGEHPNNLLLYLITPRGFVELLEGGRGPTDRRGRAEPDREGGHGGFSPQIP
jgi:hypothetical protein